MNGLYVRLQMWNGKYKHACAVTTFKSHIQNAITGVTEVSTSTDTHFSGFGVFDQCLKINYN